MCYIKGAAPIREAALSLEKCFSEAVGHIQS